MSRSAKARHKADTTSVNAVEVNGRRRPERRFATVRNRKRGETLQRASFATALLGHGNEVYRTTRTEQVLR